MPVRVLSITDQMEFGRLLEHHMSTFMDDVEFTLYSPSQRGRPHKAYVAASYDVVFLDEQGIADKTLEWLADLSKRPSFPPIILFSLQPMVTPQGALVCMARDRIANRQFASAVRQALE